LADELIGIAIAAIVFTLGVYAVRGRDRAGLRALPESWLAHETLGPAYRDWSPPGRAYYRGWARALLPYFVLLGVIFYVLVSADVTFGVQLIACVVIAGIAAGAYVERHRRGLAALASRYGLEPARRTALLDLWYLASRFLCAVGFAGIALFTARLVSELT